MKALTANRLGDGAVVFWSGEAWADRFSQARLFDAEENAVAEAAEAHAKTRITELVDPYLIEVAEVVGGVAPVSYRERLRALGPTNKPDHGKQALGGSDIDVLAHAHGAARSKGRVELIRRK
jgi:sulfite reductase (NADPH) hemoprotein beta-component